MKKLFLFSLFLILGNVSVLFAQEYKIGAWNPSSKNPFKIPVSWQETLKDYRQNWIRLTDLEFSGLHWNQGIVIYINQNHKTFVNNYVGYLRMTEGLDDEDCDPGEIYNEADDECESIFQHYPVGTIVLKENYTLNDGIPQAPVSITLMKKLKEDEADPNQNWEYLQFDSSGNVMVSGGSNDLAVQKACAECHQNIVDRDYIFSTFYRPQETMKLLK